MCSTFAKKTDSVGWGRWAVWSYDDVISKKAKGKLPNFGKWNGMDGDMETLGERRYQAYGSLLKVHTFDGLLRIITMNFAEGRRSYTAAHFSR